MAGKKNCPKCGGRGKKVSGRVMLLSTHRTYGYGERVYECRRCKEKYSIFYPIPPKSGMLPPRKDDEPDGLLRPGWLESVRGHAFNVVIGADVPGTEEEAKATEENPPEQDVSSSNE